MKLLEISMIVAVLASATQAQDIQILKHISDNDGLGTYNFEYEQSDGSRRQEKGELRNAGADNEFVAMSGSYSFVAPNGLTFNVNYIADENGFHPTADSGPTGAIPPAIAQLLGLKTNKK